MDWYYLEGDNQHGPVTEEQIVSLAREGAIRGNTLVWREGFDDWHPYSEMAGAIAGAPHAPSGVGVTQVCAECGRPFPQEDMVSYGESWVCETCKPIFVQRIREGTTLPGEFVYGGFWIRFVAKVVDGFITGAVGFAIQTTLALAFSVLGDEGEGLAFIISYFTNLGVAAVYTTFFLGYFAATPGKMVCGLKVVRPDGSRITYLRAFARHFAEFLSSLILLIGYIMAAFDDEKRTLHDHICDTRVIRS